MGLSQASLGYQSIFSRQKPMDSGLEIYLLLVPMGTGMACRYREGIIRRSLEQF